jgi:hypothetical protein
VKFCVATRYSAPGSLRREGRIVGARLRWSTYIKLVQSQRGGRLSRQCMSMPGRFVQLSWKAPGQSGQRRPPRLKRRGGEFETRQRPRVLKSGLKQHHSMSEIGACSWKPGWIGAPSIVRPQPQRQTGIRARPGESPSRPPRSQRRAPTSSVGWCSPPRAAADAASTPPSITTADQSSLIQ